MVINEAVQKLIDSSVDFSDEGTDDEEIKELVRAKFDELRQWWRDWNSSAATGEAVSALPAKIEQFILQKEPAL
jgi:V/A-type H+-transporting ATPase subunit A